MISCADAGCPRWGKLAPKAAELRSKGSSGSLSRLQSLSSRFWVCTDCYVSPTRHACRAALCSCQSSCNAAGIDAYTPRVISPNMQLLQLCTCLSQCPPALLVDSIDMDRVMPRLVEASENPTLVLAGSWELGQDVQEQ